MKLTALFSAALVIGAATLAACGSDDAGVTDLDGTTWGEATVEGYELAGTLDIVFDDGTVSVTGGCNTMNRHANGTRPFLGAFVEPGLFLAWAEGN